MTAQLNFATPAVANEPNECRFYGVVARRETMFPKCDTVIEPRYIFIGTAFYIIDGQDVSVYKNLVTAHLTKGMRVAVVVRDVNKKIPFLHVGMTVAVHLRREGLVFPKKTSNLWFADFEYSVMYICGDCKSIKLDNSERLCWLTSETRLEQALHTTRQNIGKGRKGQPRQPLLTTEANVTKFCTLISKNTDAHSEYSAMYRQISKPENMRRVMLAEMPFHFMSQMAGIQYVHNNQPVLIFTNELQFDRRAAFGVAVCDLNAVLRTRYRFSVGKMAPQVLFFAAAMTLTPELRLQPVVSTYLGPRFLLSPSYARRLLAEAVPEQIENIFNSFINQEEQGETDLQSEENSAEQKPPMAIRTVAAVRVVKLAHHVYRNSVYIQRRGRKSGVTEVFDALFVATFAAKNDLVDEKLSAFEVGAAVDYLFAEKVWHRLPVSKTNFALKIRDINDPLTDCRAIPACIERDWCATGDLIDSAKDLHCLFVDSCGTPSAVYAGSMPALSILMQNSVVDANWRASQVCWLVAKGPVIGGVLQSLTRYKDRLQPIARLLLAYKAVVVCDVHLLEMDELCILFRWLKSLQCLRLAAVGDTYPGTSSFSVLLNSSRYSSVRFPRTNMRVSGAEGDDKRQQLRLTLRNATNSAQACEQLIAQLFDGKHGVSVAENIVTSFPRRHIVIGQNYESSVCKVLSALATTTPVPFIRDQLLAATKNTRQVLETLFFTASPYIGFRGRCFRVAHVWQAHRVPDNRHYGWREEHLFVMDIRTEENNREAAAFSLDDPLLFVALDRGDDNVDDHTECCNTFDPGVMHVMTHRHELIGQSFPLARDALPIVTDEPLTLCVSQDSFNLETIYQALVTSTAFACPFILSGVTRARFTEQIFRYRGDHRSLLATRLALGE